MADIQFEHIDPYVEGLGGDTGLTSRQKLRRNFEKIKSWMDGVATALGSWFLRKDQADTAAGHISFTDGISIVGKALMNIVRSGENLSNDGAGADNAVLSEKKALETLLRKDRAETLTFLLTLSGGLSATDIQSSSVHSSNFQTGEGGAGYAIREVGGHMVLEIDDIIARRKLTVSVLDVQRTMFSQGRQVLTNANGTIERVVALDSSLQPIGISMTGFSADGYVYVLTEANAELSQQQVDDAFSAAYAYKLYFLASDDSRTIRDYWRCGDLALCREFNIAQRTNPDSDIDGNPVHNHHFHRLVLAHGTETISSKAYNFIVVANAHAVATEKVPVRIMIPLSGNEADAAIYPHDSSDTYFSRDGVNPLVAWSFDGSLPNTIPAVGDDVVHYGSVLDATRRGATALSPDSAGGILTHEKGIGGIIAYEATVTEDGETYNVADELSSPIMHQAVIDAVADWSAQQFYRQRETLHIGDNVSVEASSFLLTTSRGGVTESRPVPYVVDHPFVPGTDTANYYEQWTYGGQQWLCRAINGTSATPSTSSPDWLLVTAKGADGRDGVDGQDGRDGVDGQNGADGKDGKDGKDGTNGQDGQPGADGHDGADGKDAWVVETSPAFITIEERLLKNKDVSTPTSDDPDDYYMPEDAQGIPHLQVAVIAPSAIEIRILKGGSRITPSSLNFWEKSSQRGCSSNLTVQLVSGTTDQITVGLSTAGTTDRSTQGEIYLIVSFTEDGATRTQYVTLPVAINRTGTYVSETIGDVTVDTRQRIAAVDGKTETYKSQWVQEASGIKGRLDKVVTSSGGKGQWITQIEATAEGISQSVSELEDDVDANYSEFTQTALAITQSVGAVDGRVSTVEQTADDIKLYVEGTPGNILPETDWRGKTIKHTFYPHSLTEKTYSSGAYYYPFDKVTNPNFSGEVKDFAMMGATSARGNSATGDPWVQLLPDNTPTHLTRWTAQNAVWVVVDAFRHMAAMRIVKPVFRDNETHPFDTSRVSTVIGSTIQPSTVYTLSFFYRSWSTLFLNIQGIFDTNATLTDSQGNTGKAIVNGVAVTEIASNPVFANTNGVWTRATITFQTLSSLNSYAILGFDAYSSNASQKSEIEVTMPKLEEGYTATPWTDMATQLERSGLDIYAGKIVANTNNFEVHNQSGQKTFGIDAQGNLTATGGAKFSGTVDAKILYTSWKRIVNPVATEGSFDILSFFDTDEPLPQRLTIFNDRYLNSSSFDVYVNLPDPRDYEGLEFEVFFPGMRSYESYSIEYLSPRFIFRNRARGTSDERSEQVRLYYNEGDEANGETELIGALNFIDTLWGNSIQHVYSAHQYFSEPNVRNQEFLSSRVRFLAVKEVHEGTVTNPETGNTFNRYADWRWVILDYRDCTLTSQ